MEHACHDEHPEYLVKVPFINKPARLAVNYIKHIFSGAYGITAKQSV